MWFTPYIIVAYSSIMNTIRHSLFFYMLVPFLTFNTSLYCYFTALCFNILTVHDQVYKLFQPLSSLDQLLYSLVHLIRLNL